MLDFEEDGVRRRAWQERLYFDLYSGHVVSIELVCEDSTDFLDDVKILSNFKSLESINLLFFNFRDYENIRANLTSLYHNKLKIYALDGKSPYFRQIKIV